MKKEDTGLFCLLAAVFFSIIAGGHVQLDAQPETRGSIGLLMTFIASLAAAWCLITIQKSTPERPPNIAYGLLVPIVLFLLYDVLLGGEAYSMMRVLVAVLVYGGLAFVVSSSRIVQMPTVVYAGFTALLIASLGTSILVSEFRTVSLSSWVNWITYAAGMYLAVSVLGRVRGPKLLIETVVLSAGIVATKGVIEYLLVRADEPTFRIFADWNNPNALAGLLVVALPLALVVACASVGYKRIGAWAIGAAIVVALWSTQSLGGLVIAPIGVAALLVAAIAWHGRKRLLPALVPLGTGVALIFLVSVTTSSNPSSPAIASAMPAAAAARSSEQAGSSGYRMLLWNGAVQLVKDRPIGYGVGTYRFYSAQSGLNEQTHLTHQTYLQVAVEGGLIALVGLLGLGMAWIVRMFVGAKALDHERNLLRAGVFGAVIAAAANGFIESNLYYFGAGFLFFVILGAGLQLAADGTSPESLQKSLRATIVVVCCVLPLFASLGSMYVESAKSQLLNATVAKDVPAISAARESLMTLAGQDGEAWYFLGWIYPDDAKERLEFYEKAVKLAPSTRIIRALATEQAATGNVDEALSTIDLALRYDPNNLRTLTLKLQIEDGAGRSSKAIQTARRLIAVEQSSYMQTRALSELVPTETYEARCFLAEHTQDMTEKTRLLREAVEGFLRYKAVTVPKVLLFSSEGYDFLGETRMLAEEKMAKARKAAEELSRIYRESGDPSSAEEVRELAKGLTVD